MNYRKVTSIDELKKMIEEGYHDFFIMLNFGLRSSKTIDYSEEASLFYVENEIDDSEQELTESEMMDENCTNIGKAIKCGAFYAY